LSVRAQGLRSKREGFRIKRASLLLPAALLLSAIAPVKGYAANAASLNDPAVMEFATENPRAAFALSNSFFSGNSFFGGDLAEDIQEILQDIARHDRDALLADIQDLENDIRGISVVSPCE